GAGGAVTADPRRVGAAAAAPESVARGRGSGGRRPRLARKDQLAVSAARDPLWAAGGRQDDGRASGIGRGKVAAVHAVRQGRAVRRGERADAAMGSPGNDQSASWKRTRPDLSRQPPR